MFATQIVNENQLIRADLDNSIFSFASPKLLKDSQWIIIVNLDCMNDSINSLLPQISRWWFSPDNSQIETQYFSTIYGMYVENANNLWRIRNERIGIYNYFNTHSHSIGQPIQHYLHRLENQYIINTFKIDYLNSSRQLIDTLNDTHFMNSSLGSLDSSNIE